MTLTISNLSTEYIKVPVRKREAGEYVDPTGDPVEFAFIADGSDPTVSDWVVGSWESHEDNYWARCLIGPDGGVVNLGTDTYTVWIKIKGTTETPVHKVPGNLVVS